MGVVLMATAASRVVEAETYPVAWNDRAASSVLSRNALNELTPVVPEWKARHMLWPADLDLQARQCKATEEQRSDCIRWIAKYVNAVQIPPELDTHLVALGGWAALSEHSSAKDMKADVFLTRFRKGPHVIQIQESPSNVIITIADERLAAQGRADHVPFVTETAALLLKEPLRPNVSSPKFHAADLGEGTHGTKITRVSWIIESVLTPGSDGKEVVSQDKAVEVGTTSVEAETDGRYVRFELRKETFAPGIDPFVPRFARD